MKKLFFLYLFSLTILLVGCDYVSPETANAFKGEYWMETTSTIMQGNEVVGDTPRTVWSPVSIYEKKGKLFVQTNWFGAPNTQLEEMSSLYVEEYRERPDFISERRIEYVVPRKDSIEIIVVDGSPQTIMMNGFIYTIHNGAYIKSLPISVKSGSETKLELKDCEPIPVEITNTTGEYLTKIKNTYKYGPMLKNNEVITWQVDLTLTDLPETDHSIEFDHIIYRNTLYKR